jgi:hypothetical protein
VDLFDDIGLMSAYVCNVIKKFHTTYLTYECGNFLLCNLLGGENRSRLISSTIVGTLRKEASVC